MKEATIQDGKVADFLHDVGNAPLSVLMLDFDGTLAPFSPHRGRVLLYEGVRDALQDIVDKGRTRLLIVTGRDGREIGPLLGIQPAPEVWGVHGLQRVRSDGKCEMPEVSSTVKGALDAARRWLAYQNVEDLAEIKPGAIAVHWRGLSEADAFELHSRILLGWSPLTNRTKLELLEFDGGVEVRMRGPNKGDAVRTILQEVGERVPVAYLGDDFTDENAFRALARRGLTALVRPEPRPTSAQLWITTPDGLLMFLQGWAEATETELSTENIAVSH